MFIGSCHHEHIFDEEKRKKAITHLARQIRKLLRLKGVKGPKRRGQLSLVGTGMSGALILPELARRLDLPFAIVREPGAKPRVGRTLIIGEIKQFSIFVDDLISMGTTLRRTNKILMQYDSRLVGAATLMHSEDAVREVEIKVSPSLYREFPKGVQRPVSRIGIPWVKCAWFTSDFAW